MKERRKRLMIPRSILFTGILFIVIPFVNFYLIKEYYQIKANKLYLLLQILNPIEFSLLLFPVIIGIGLLKIKKWAWWGVLLYGISLIMYNLFTISNNLDRFHIQSTLLTIFGFTLIFFFLRKDISAPYFKLYPRGWRGENRKPIEIEVTIDGKGYQTLDVSNTGIYVDWKNCEKELGDEVLIIFKPDSNLNSSVLKETKAGVVRIDESGVGLAFRK